MHNLLQQPGAGFPLGSLATYIINPVNKEDTLYILFTTVHLLQCVRKNWINIRNNQKTFDTVNTIYMIQDIL